MVAAPGHARRTDGRLRALDALRFVAAFAVVLFHYTGRDSVAWDDGVRVVFPFLSRFTAYGGFGPFLFFMISGFVVLMSTWGRPVHSFVASRVGRLFPAYWLTVVVTATVLFLNRHIIEGWDSLGVAGVAVNLTMAQSAFGVGNVDPVFWTLWVELKFYLLLGVMALVGISRERLLVLCLLWPVLGALAAQTGTVLLVALLEPTSAPFFCIGMLVYLIHRDGPGVSVGLLLGLNYCFALWTCSSHIPANLAASGAQVSFRGLAVLLTLSVAALVGATLTRLGDVNWTWLTLLGALTYPLYLIHEVPGWVLIRRLGPVLPAYTALCLVIVVMLAAAYVVHRFVERPLGGRLRRAVERDLGRPPEQPGGSTGPVSAGRASVSRQALLGAQVPGPQAPGPRGTARPAAAVPAPTDRPTHDVVDDGPLVPAGR